MTKERLTRKIRAILSADAVGYSSLMQKNEYWTIKAIVDSRSLMSECIAQYKGRVVDAPGDNLLAEFASVVDAIECAVEIQRKLKSIHASQPNGHKLKFRIGVNLGDIVQQNDRIYGDGVNIAARIESLAEPGGIFISHTAYDQVKNKLEVGYEYMGEHSLKNIAEPVRVYRVLENPENSGKVIGAKKAKLRGRKLGILAAAVILILVSITITFWHLSLRSVQQSEKFDSKHKMASSLSEKPSIAVLPFKNIGGDPGQEYFSDGITNDIISDLSKFSELSVLASNSVFAYKGKPVTVQKVNQELGARYILGGSVQKENDKIRVNAQLIDATSGHNIWAERYYRDMKNVFALQDDIVQAIVTTLAVKIDTEERKRVMRKDTENFEAYDYVLRGWEYYLRSTRSENTKAQHMFEEAIALDHRYATAYVGLGQTYMAEFAYGWTEFSNQALQRAHDLAQKALNIDETTSSAHALLGEVFRYRMQYDLAIREYKRAIELNPNDANSHAELGAIMNYSGKTDLAIKELETSFSFNPHMRPSNYMQLGLAYYLKGRYDDAIETLEQGLSWYPTDVFINIPLAAAYAKVGRLKDAERVATKVRKFRPFFEVDNYGTAFINQTDRSKIVDGLRKAGL
jgi:adenylate cyclase